MKPHMSNPRARRVVRNGEAKAAREQKRQRRAERDLHDRRVEDLALALQSKRVTDLLVMLAGQEWRLGNRLSDGFAHDLASAVVEALDA